MLVRFKGKDPRAGQEIALNPAAAKRYISDGLAEAVKGNSDEAEKAAGAEEAVARAPAPAAKKAGRSR